MTLVYLVIWGTMLLCGSSAVWALVWAIRTHQMRHFAKGAASIFDAHEPIGQPTDRFPGSRARTLLKLFPSRLRSAPPGCGPTK